MRLDASLAVEHVKPKSLIPWLERRWNNFLLGCTNCNSSKLDTPVRLKDNYWPDRDNTFRAFEYSAGGMVRVAEGLTDKQTRKAEITRDLVGLDRWPGHKLSRDKIKRGSDRRWIGRRDAWETAQRAYTRLKAYDIPEMREQIAETAAARGYWSIWYTIFIDDPDMLHRLRAVFPGTATCFDAKSGCPRRRTKGDL